MSSPTSSGGFQLGLRLVNGDLGYDPRWTRMKIFRLAQVPRSHRRVERTIYVTCARP